MKEIVIRIPAVQLPGAKYDVWACAVMEAEEQEMLKLAALDSQGDITLLHRLFRRI